MYEFQNDYIKPKYGEKVKLCYMDTECFIVYIKTDDSYNKCVEDVKARLDPSNYELNRRLPTVKNNNFIGAVKD